MHGHSINTGTHTREWCIVLRYYRRGPDNVKPELGTQTSSGYGAAKHCFHPELVQELVCVSLHVYRSLGKCKDPT